MNTDSRSLVKDQVHIGICLHVIIEFDDVFVVKFSVDCDFDFEVVNIRRR